MWLSDGADRSGGGCVTLLKRNRPHAPLGEPAGPSDMMTPNTAARDAPLAAAIGARRASTLVAARPRVALVLFLVAAAMPVRIAHSVPLVNSFSVLDVLIIGAGITLFLDLSFRPLDVGYPALFALLCVPMVVTIASMVWSEDRSTTSRAVFVYAEGLIVYLFVLRELEGLGPERIVTYIKRYAYLLIVPGVLLLFHVPGFAPEIDAKHSSGAYLTYFTRLSHPVLGASNNLAGVLAFFAPILLYWGHVRKDKAAFCAGLVTLLAIFLTLSRGILLAFLLAGAIYAVATYGRPRLAPGLGAKIVGLAALGVVAISVFYVANPPTHEFFSGRLSPTNADTRVSLISSAVSKIASHPFLGYGGGVEPLLSTIDPAADPAAKLDSHNAYLQQILNFGLPLGVIVSVALWATVVFFFARLRSAPVAGILAFTLLVQCASFLFESAFEGTVLRVLFYLSIGFAAALLRSVEQGQPAS
jgi:hypothetical protein